MCRYLPQWRLITIKPTGRFIFVSFGFYCMCVNCFFYSCNTAAQNHTNSSSSNSSSSSSNGVGSGSSARDVVINNNNSTNPLSGNNVNTLPGVDITTTTVVVGGVDQFIASRQHNSLTVNGEVRFYVQNRFSIENTNVSANTTNYHNEAPFSSVYFHLYSWVYFGVSFVGNRIYISRCVLMHPRLGTRYILMRCLLSMCSRPRRGFFVYDTEYTNPHDQFVIWTGNIVFIILILYL
jgi:hypothetical protein